LSWYNFPKKISNHFRDSVARKKSTTLYIAVKDGNLSEVRKLLKNGANPNIRCAHNLTPLHHAAYWGEVRILELLIKNGANVNTDNGGGRGWTPLHSAAISGGLKKRREVIEILIKNKADLNKKDKLGWTPKDYMLLWEKDPKGANDFKKYISKFATANQEHREPKRPDNFKTPKH